MVSSPYFFMPILQLYFSTDGNWTHNWEGQMEVINNTIQRWKWAHLCRKSSLQIEKRHKTRNYMCEIVAKIYAYRLSVYGWIYHCRKYHVGGYSGSITNHRTYISLLHMQNVGTNIRSCPEGKAIGAFHEFFWENWTDISRMHCRNFFIELQYFMTISPHITFNNVPKLTVAGMYSVHYTIIYKFKSDQCVIFVLPLWLWYSVFVLNPNNALDRYPTMHHFVTEMYTPMHISVTKWCIVGYETGAL